MREPTVLVTGQIPWASWSPFGAVVEPRTVTVIFPARNDPSSGARTLAAWRSSVVNCAFAYALAC